MKFRTSKAEQLIAVHTNAFDRSQEVTRVSPVSRLCCRPQCLVLTFRDPCAIWNAAGYYPGSMFVSLLTGMIGVPFGSRP